MDCTSGDIETARWKDLPETVLSHVLRLAPYKRADVKLVCQPWRTAVNASLKSVTITQGDLDLLHQLTAVQELTVTAPEEAAWETIRPYAESHGSTGPAGSQNAAQSLEAGFAALQTTPSSSRGPANPWSNAHPGSMQRLRVLNLQSCSHVFRQLAKWQEQQLGAAPATLHTSVASLDTSDGSISSSERVRPGLFRLEELRLSNLATISPHLPMLLVGQKLVRWTPDAPSPAASSSSRSNSSTSALPPWPLQHLSALHINCCMGVDEVSAVLSQLPCLRTFEASSCSDLWEVPAGVCDCTTLTQLKLPRTTLYCLPPTISKLQQLQVLDLSVCTNLVCLSSGISSLTQLTDLDLSGPNMLFKQNQKITYLRNRHPVGPERDAASTAYSLNLEAARAHPLSEQQQFGVLPELSTLSSLRRLRLVHNRDMRVLPSSVCSLTQLQVLDASSCSLRYLNDELWQCVGLQELLLGDNVLALMSEDIRGLTNLEVLDIGRSNSLWRLPSALLSLPQLRRLLLSNKAVGQGLLERLELRSPNPVDVECDNYDSDSDYYGWGAEEDTGDLDADAY